jgi:hypothetical protein
MIYSDSDVGKEETDEGRKSEGEREKYPSDYNKIDRRSGRLTWLAVETILVVY